MKKLFLVCVVVILSGCLTKVNLNMGESDYRIAIMCKDKSKEECDDDVVQFVAKYQSDQALPTRIITASESISVHLKTVFIDNYSERAERFFAQLFSTTVRGEIAIVARVFELGQGENLDFRGSATRKLGRLIYYTEDVRTGGHLLNLSMLPIYGPITYKGNPLVIQLTVLELDVGESQQMKALLSTLANLGAKAYAPASPILKLLDALGEQLLSGEQDDIELQYIFLLYPEGGRHQSAPYSHLATGDYILMRQNPNKLLKEYGDIERFNQLRWKEGFQYCPEHGRLYKISDKDGKPCGECASVPSKDLEPPTCEYRENTYLVIQINSGFSPIELDLTQKYTEFQVEMEESVDNSVMEEKLKAALDEYIESTTKAKDRAKIDVLHAQAIHFLEIACSTTEARETSHYISELFDVVVGKRGMPGEPDDKQEFTDAQWSRLLYAMRQQAKHPYNITKKAVQNVVEAKDLADLLECTPDGA